MVLRADRLSSSTATVSLRILALEGISADAGQRFLNHPGTRYRTPQEGAACTATTWIDRRDEGTLPTPVRILQLQRKSCGGPMALDERR